MPYTNAHLDMAIRHVADGERHIARQKEIIARLAGWGHSTDVADRLLAVFEKLWLSTADILRRFRPTCAARSSLHVERMVAHRSSDSAPSQRPCISMNRPHLKWRFTSCRPWENAGEDP
jgi:hypothetical protein